jgi:hypothetical protein
MYGMALDCSLWPRIGVVCFRAVYIQKLNDSLGARDIGYIGRKW